MINGIVLVNKPVGISSNKIVNMVKYKLGAKKCGHLGTLDQEGAGLLPVTVGKATKIFDYFLNKDKTYETIFRFGIETDTLDASGKILNEDKNCDIKIQDVKNASKLLIGKYAQMPPQFSAKKVGGKIAYKEARQGRTLELKPKEIEIFDIKLLKQLDKNVFSFEITCSSGTYIRCVARDMAKILSTYGIMQCITRTRCGIFNLKDANTLDDIENGKINVIECEKVFDFENLIINELIFNKLQNGQKVNSDKKDGVYKLFYNENFLGLGEINSGKLQFKLRLF